MQRYKLGSGWQGSSSAEKKPGDLGKQQAENEPAVSPGSKGSQQHPGLELLDQYLFTVRRKMAHPSSIVFWSTKQLFAYDLRCEAKQELS